MQWNAVNRWNMTCRVDLRSSLWTYENCKAVTDIPRHVVHTTALGKPCYMYTSIKLTPALYDFDIRMAQGVECSCTAEIVEVMPDGTRRSRNRCATAGDVRQTLRWMVLVDSNVELRLRFNEKHAMRVVSFDHMIVRSRRKLVIPFQKNVLSGVQTMVRLSYSLSDLHRVLKMMHGAMSWLKVVEGMTKDMAHTIASPLWDPSDNPHAFADMVQTLRTTLVEEAPDALFATNSYYKISLDAQLCMPLISRTLITNLSDCIMARDILERKDEVLAALHHALHYINFMFIEYVDFKQRLQDKVAHNNRVDEVGVIRTVDLPLEFATALKPAAV